MDDRRKFMTEKQKYWKEAFELCEKCGISGNNIIIKDIAIPRGIYLDALNLMSEENLTSHKKHLIEEERYEQVEIILEELNKRKISNI